MNTHHSLDVPTPAGSHPPSSPDAAPVPAGPTRRALLLGAGVGAVGLAVASAGAPGAHAASSSAAMAWGQDTDREPSGTRVERIDDTGVLLQYDRVVPAFDAWAATHPTPTRGRVSLDGTWDFAFDPQDRGIEERWFDPGTQAGPWGRIAVPSSWDLLDTPTFDGYDGTHFGEGTAFADGAAWYRRTIDIPRGWRGRHVRLMFLAVNYRADVWVDGIHLGSHEGGQTAFSVPVTPLVRPSGRTTVVVRVHRRASFLDYSSNDQPVTDDEAIPYKPVDYWPYAGITRSAWIEAVAETSIPKVLVAAAGGVLEVRAVVENTGRRRFRGSVVVTPDADTGGRETRVAVDVPAGGVRVATVRIPVPGASAWTAEAPTTYRVTTSLRSGPVQNDRPVQDAVETRFGMRSVAVVGTELQVNGEAVFLKGVNWHEETGASGRSLTIAEYDHELGHLLELEATMMRNCVYNRHPYAYEWADEHGVLVMDDTDNMWLNTAQERLQTERYGLSRALTSAMVWNQHNHPSVILWGLQNESEIDGGGAPVYRAWLSDMKDAVRELDLHERPVTWASGSSWDPAFDLADVIGFNEYFGYFYGSNGDLGPTLDAVHANHPDKPIAITENGSWSYLGNRGPATEPGTEDWQAANLQAHWDQVVARPFVAGYMFWVLKDYKQRLGYNQELNGISTMGLLGWDSQTRRLAFDTYRDADPPR